jgi:hypothetical protein
VSSVRRGVARREPRDIFELVYTTCIFCHGALGANEAIEHFPVGRRLAFDGEKGRLWVVCRRCERWNLTPIEERWEAIEAARVDRQYWLGAPPR